MKQKSDTAFLFLNFSKLFSGLVLVQVINFLFSLIIPRFFTSTDLGEFGIFLGLVLILAVIVNARFDIAVMLGKTEENTHTVLDAAITFSLLFSLLILLITLLGLAFYPAIYIMIPFTVLLYGIHQPIIVYLNKQEKYNTINLFRGIQVLVTVGASLLLALLKVPHGLIYGFTGGLFLATLFTLYFYKPAFSTNSLSRAWKQYLQFPKFSILSSLFDNASRNSIPLVLSFFFPQTMVGYFAYSTRLMNAPTGMYTSALGQVYFKNASVQDNEKLRKTTRSVILTTFLIGILPALIIFLFGPEIFDFLFGNAWAESGTVAKYLVFWYLTLVITSPITSVLDIKLKLKFELGVSIVSFIGRVAAIVIGGLFHNFYLSILLFAGVGILVNLYLLYYINFTLLRDDINKSFS